MNLKPIQPSGLFKILRDTLPKNSAVEFNIYEPEIRGVSATAGNLEVRNVKKVNIRLSTKLSFKLLFDNESSLEEKFINEQFSS